MTAGDSAIHADGRFSLGYPRRDGGEEINARVRIVKPAARRSAARVRARRLSGRRSAVRRVPPLRQLRDAVRLRPDDHRAGRRLRRAVRTATAALRFEGNGVRLDAMDIAKSTGSGHRRRVRRVGRHLFVQRRWRARSRSRASRPSAIPRAPLSGVLDFSASGSGTFDEPRYDVRGRRRRPVRRRRRHRPGHRPPQHPRRAADDASSRRPRRVWQSPAPGRIALTPETDAELTFRFADTSLDPYVRAFEPRLSPFTTAIASGTIRVFGELAQLRPTAGRGQRRAARHAAVRLPASATQRPAAVLDRATGRPPGSTCG